MKAPALPPIGIIGFGNMGEAVAAGLLNTSPRPQVSILEHRNESVAKALMQYKLKVAAQLSDLVKDSEILILAIKPSDIPALLADLQPLAAGKAFISVAAGLKTSYFQQALQTNQVVRFMPNLAAKVGKSLVGVSPGAGVTDKFAAQALKIAEVLGTAALMPEKLLAAITGVSGSGLAFVFHFVHALALGGVREGFSYPKALDYALSTLEGAAALLRSGEHPIALESKVISPAGTTIEGVRVLEAGGFTQAVMDAVTAASRRAGELEK